jgi:hypothetical protein
MVAEWCGVRNGRVRVNSPLAIRPATEWTMEVSSSSAGDSGGNRPGSLAAIIDLPEPGGPMNSRLWPPAAAISSARLAFSWPFTSRRSGALPASTTRPGVGGDRIWVPRKWLTREISDGAARMRVSPAQAASAPQASGQIRPRPSAPAATAAGRAPGALTIRPSRDSSPMAAQSASASGWITPMAAITARAIGRS